VLSFHSTNYTEAQLITLWQEGNEQAFEVFLQKAFDTIDCIAYNKTRRREVAENWYRTLSLIVSAINVYRHKYIY